MKRNFTLLSLILILCSLKFNAQIFRGVSLTGFTHDVIAENAPAKNTTDLAIDAAGYVLYSALYTNTTTLSGLNSNGVYSTASRTYSLAPYASKNSLRIATNGVDSLTLTQPQSYSVLSLLGFSSGLDALTDVTLRFTDGTSTTYSSRTLYNWSSSQPAIIAGFGKTNRTTDAIYFTATEPKMYSIDIPVACVNQTKQIKRVVVRNKTNGAVVYLFAAAGVGKSSYVANAMPATCNGSSTGTVKVLGVDSYGPLTYTWMPGMQNTQTVNNVPAGNYTVTVVDGNGCTFTSTVAVSQPSLAFTLAATGSSVSCGTSTLGSVSATALGGNAPYTYTWDNMAPTTTTLTNNTLTGLSSGTYMVTVKDNNGCVQTATAAVTSTNNAVAALSTASLQCNTANGSATVTTVTGGVGPYTYSWSPGTQTTSVVSNLAAGIYTLTLTDNGNSGCVSTQTFAINAPSLSLITSATTCSLSTGSATVSAVNGGAGGPYTYTWSPAGGNAATATGLAAGNYTVTATDNASCPISLKFFLGVTTPTISVATNSLLCSNLPNGSATVTAVSGLTGPYSYTWMPSSQTGSVAANLGAGIYTVSVKSTSGCVSTQTVLIDAPSVAVASSSTSCKGTQPTGSATVTTINGGVAPYTYTWDSNTMPNFANTHDVGGLDEGTYTVSVSDANNCVFSSTLAVTGPTTAALNAVTSATAATCSGINDGVARVTATGGMAPYAYSWNTNPPQYTSIATGLPSPNTFISSVIDFNGCLISKPVTIYPAPTQLTLYASPSTTICPGTSAVLSITGLSGTGTFTWSTGAHTTTTTVTPTATLTTYSVSGVTTAGCAVQGSISVMTSTAAAENCPTGLKENADVSYSLYPNPTTGEFTIAFGQSQDNATVEVMDALGKVVLSQQVSGMETKVNTASLTNGMYFVTVRDKDKIKVRAKVIKQ